MRRYVLTACLLPVSLLFSCQDSPPNLAAADEYLKALQNNDVPLVSELTCIAEHADVKSSVAPGIEDWELVKETQETSPDDPADQYVNVTAEIEYTGSASLVKDLFVLTVWKTDDLHESQKRLIERGNKIGESSRQLINTANELLGNPPEPNYSSDSITAPPSRDTLSSKEYCVTRMQLYSELE